MDYIKESTQYDSTIDFSCRFNIIHFLLANGNYKIVNNNGHKIVYENDNGHIIKFTITFNPKRIPSCQPSPHVLFKWEVPGILNAVKNINKHNTEVLNDYLGYKELLIKGYVPKINIKPQKYKTIRLPELIQSCVNKQSIKKYDRLVEELNDAKYLLTDSNNEPAVIFYINKYYRLNLIKFIYDRKFVIKSTSETVDNVSLTDNHANLVKLLFDSFLPTN